MKTWKKQLGSDTWKLTKKIGSVGQIIWVMFCERNGVEIKDTREVRSRLDKETKTFFEVL